MQCTCPVIPVSRVPEPSCFEAGIYFLFPAPENIVNYEAKIEAGAVAESKLRLWPRNPAGQPTIISG